MKKKTVGIHHITSIVGHPQENVNFYAGVLGLRMVKKTVNFDDPNTYHFYFGDEMAKPGTIITFFPWANSKQGVIGDGQVGITTYVIPIGAMSFWKERLKKFSVQTEISKRFGETFLQFSDVHGLRLELVERTDGELNTWRFEDITPEVAIKGFGGAVLFSADAGATEKVLKDIMGLDFAAKEGDFMRFSSEADLGNVVDLKLTSSGMGKMGVGTVHHIAWRASDDADQAQWQNHVASLGQRVTDVQDRNYFKAIYFREAGKILHEIATDLPGFAHDESQETMGEKLMLPEQYEPQRSSLEQSLIPFDLPRGE